MMKSVHTASRMLVLSAMLVGFLPGKILAESAGPELVPGMIGCYATPANADKPVCVRIDPGVAFDWSDGMPDDRLSEGDFQVTWEGFVRIPHAGQYQFAARAQGAVRIWFQGRQVFPQSANVAATISADAGTHPLRVEYDAPAGKAKIHLLWSSDTFSLEVINPRYLAHDAQGEAGVAEQLLEQRGREVVERYGCARCHPIAGVDRSRKPGLPMPHAAHMNPDWVARWVRNPQAVRPGTRMGAPGGTPEEIETLVSSLLSLLPMCDSYGMIDSGWRCSQDPDPLAGADLDACVRAGRTRFYELGCSACHAPETPQLVDPTRGPSLADIGSKWSNAYLRQLMLNPVRRHPTGGMPGYKIDAQEVDQLVAYMSTFRLPPPTGDAAKLVQQWPTPPRVDLRPGQSILDPDVLTAVKAPVRTRFCYACHSPENTPVDGPKLDPATARWTAGCLRSDRAASLAPQFTLTSADRKAVIAFLSGRPEQASPVATGEVAQRFIDQTVYCFACHQRDGKGGEPLARTLAHFRPDVPADPATTAPDPILPPDLSGVGARLNRPWMLETLAGNSPSNRLWLKVKMPNYGLSDAERTLIAGRLAVADEIPDLTAPRETGISRTAEAAADTLISSQGFACIKCHFLGAQAFQATNIAPDFTLVTRRVSRAWYYRWLSDPARIMPGTPMPAIALPVAQIADDNLAVQREIIWRFLQRQATRPDMPGK
jgi:mono/diheme cytochrome c family protein